MVVDHVSASLAQTHGSEKWDGETTYDEYAQHQTAHASCLCPRVLHCAQTQGFYGK